MDFVLGVDLGTSYFKLGLFNLQGDLCGLGRIAVLQDAGGGSLSQIPIERFWALLRCGVQDACRQAQTGSDHIRAVAYASQANSFVLLDGAKKPLTPIILWSDNRAQDLPNIEDLFQQKDFLQQTGLGLACNHQFCVAKLLWLQKHQPDLWARAVHLMTLSDYFTYALTEQMVGDAGTASLLGLLNIHSLQWQRNIVDLGQLQLSTPLWPGTVAGEIHRSGAELLGLQEGIPLVVGSLDHHMAALGAGLGQVADMSESTGTVLACLTYAAEFNPGVDICIGVGLKKGQYYQLVFDGNGAGALEWYQKNYAAEHSMAKLEELAAGIEIGSEGLLALPGVHRYQGLDGFKNRSSLHRHGHYVRAILESTAASLLPLVRKLTGHGPPKRIVATGGGARNDLWLQIKSDLLNIEYVTTGTPASACMGAAMFASLAVGWFSDLEAVAGKWIKISKTFRPKIENHLKYLNWYGASFR